ncbi:MAG: cytochrome C oxidase subunit IV family protein [Akkermansiaceae bacterium]
MDYSKSQKSLELAPPPGTRMPDAHELEESVTKATRTYLFVGGLLFLGTIATVLVATVPWLDIGEHGFDKWDAMLGLGIATFKASLVALVFMHLNHERRLIYVFMVIAALHAAGFFIGTYMHFWDTVHDQYFFEEPRPRQEGTHLAPF